MRSRPTVRHPDSGSKNPAEYCPGAAELLCHCPCAGRIRQRCCRQTQYGTTHQSRWQSRTIRQVSVRPMYSRRRRCSISTIRIARPRSPSRGDPSDRQSLDTALAAQRAALADKHGAGLRILTGSITSPTLAAQLDALRRQYPEARWHQWDPISRDSVRHGARCWRMVGRWRLSRGWTWPTSWSRSTATC